MLLASLNVEFIMIILKVCLVKVVSFHRVRATLEIMLGVMPKSTNCIG